MVNHPIEHFGTTQPWGKRLARSLPAWPVDESEDDSSPRRLRVSAQPGAISTKALLGALLVMALVGTGVLSLMHSLRGDSDSSLDQLRAVELYSMAAPVATPGPSFSR
jgi:hypothetical protein